MRGHTISRPVELSGKGLHSGEQAKLRLLPGEPGGGVVFRRCDLPGAPPLSGADMEVDGTKGQTTLRRGEAHVQTVEHLAAAVGSLGITTLAVELSGPEIPAGDGSALPYVQLLQEAGIVELDSEAPRLAPPVFLREEDGETSLTLLPATGHLQIDYTIHYPGESLAQGRDSFEITPESFVKEIAPARTFCLAVEAEGLRAHGYGRGADTQNTLLLDGPRVIGNTLRFPDEPLRHKILDLVGDLALLGRRLEAKLVAVRSGHRLNRKLVAKLRELVPVLQGREFMLESGDIQKILPHRYPFLLIDRVLILEENRRIVALKNVTANEPFFPGHFPGEPIMPGVLQVEAMAQAAGVLLLHKLSDARRLPLLMSMDRVKWRRPVRPGDQLLLEAELSRIRGNIGEIRARALVQGEVASEAEIRFVLTDM